MPEDDDLWAAGVGAWVTLADLAATVERETRIPRDQAARALRQPLEAGNIRAELEGWKAPTDPRSDVRYWARSQIGQERYWITSKGWQHVDFKAGTLAGCPVLVNWGACQPHLAGLRAAIARREKAETQETETAKVEPAKKSGGAPAKHDWHAFWIEVALFTDENDLDPDRRPQLHNHMVEWTAEHMDDPAPDPTTIRKLLARLYGAVAARGAYTRGT